MGLTVTEIVTQRYRCKRCGQTVTASPREVGRARRRHAFRTLIGVLYGLGLSHRGVETALGLFGHRVDHVSIQRLGQAVCRQLPQGDARVVEVYETWVKVRGQPKPVGVVVDVGGRTLGIELTGAGFDYQGWFEALEREPGVQVVVTDDSRDYRTTVEVAQVRRQQCLVHMKRTLGRAKHRLGPVVRQRHGRLLEQITEGDRELPGDGATKLPRWYLNTKPPLTLRRWLVHLPER